MNAEDYQNSLIELGFTRLEAEIYIYLIKHSPATGYGVAKGINRFKTNVYESLVALEGKGAILVDHGRSRLYRAVPPEEFLEQMERRFLDNQKRAMALAAELGGSGHDDRVYTLSTLEQVYERSRAMLESCEEVALLELDPGPLEVLRDAMEAAAMRGVNITVRVYRPASLKGVRVLESTFMERSKRRSIVQWMALCVDGKQYLVAYIEPESGKVHQAVWSASSILSEAYFSLLNADFKYYSLRPHLESASTVEEVRAEFEKLEELFPLEEYPGYRELRKRFGW